MTMEDRCLGHEDGAILGGSTLNFLKSKSCEPLTSTNASYHLHRTNKRSFDVAFLMAPDEKLIKRQNERLNKQIQYNQIKLVKDIANLSTNERHPLFKDCCRDYDLSRNLDVKSSQLSSGKYKMVRTSPTRDAPLFSPEKRKPDFVKIENYSREKVSSSQKMLLSNIQNRSINVKPKLNNRNEYFGQQLDTRSAFTKVNFTSMKNSDGTSSPRSSISPDVSYQNSMSPPICQTRPSPPNFPSKIPYPFLIPLEGQNPTLLDNIKLSQMVQQQQQLSKPPSPQISNVVPRPENYPSLPYNSLTIFPPITSAEALVRPRFLTTGLLPQSFAALSLPAQNVCAKCNLSFRMTSDLVYHMRSHHKTENVNDLSRRRREEKLRCLVCDETFRERHHLTRHMTAHQDKESDAVVDPFEIKTRSVPAGLVQGK